MDRVRNHWITTLTLVVAGLLTALGVGVLFGDDGVEAWRVGYTTGSVLGALAILGGLWRLRSDNGRLGVANALVVGGAVVFAVGYWWIVFVPPVLALVVVYAGVIRHGLKRELHPA
jgi:hypothetical protein